MALSYAIWSGAFGVSSGSEEESFKADLKFLIALPRPVAMPGRRLPPNRRRTIANTNMSSQGPIPNILSPLDFDSEILLAHAFKCDRLQLRMAIADYRNFVKRRQTGEPVAYITGVKEFFGYEFEVNPSVLIPRPDTEKLVEVALEKLPKEKELRVIDVCTGSGCVAISLALERPLIKVIATELSEKAAEVARRNIKKHGLEDRVEVRVGHLLDPVEGHFDLIVSNPPYIKPADMAGLMRDVRDFEPHLALQGLGENGLELHEEILKKAPLLLTKGAFVLLEIGYDQAHFFKDRAKIIQDDAGNDRIVEICCG
jgi:release factor glutamine methyltransferase